MDGTWMTTWRPAGGLQAALRLDDTVAVVSGASSGLGRATACALSELGAHVVVSGRRANALDDVVAQIRSAGGTALAVVADTRIPEACAEVAERAAAQGSVRALVCCAGVASSHPATREQPEAFRAVIDTNLMGTYWMCQSVGGVISHGGSIVLVSSVLGLVSVGLPQAAYSTSKAGLMGLARDLAVQWATRRNIRVNCLCPGYFESPMLDELQTDTLEELLRVIPVRRIAAVDEIANVAAFLSTDAASYLTGATIVADGGLSVR
jgi:NAD(P)-dependent dehydrogenase (short-subunit alcohol dehydrogenase family)